MRGEWFEGHNWPGNGEITRKKKSTFFTQVHVFLEKFTSSHFGTTVQTLGRSWTPSRHARSRVGRVVDALWPY